MRTTVDIDVRLLERLRAEAKRRELPVTRLLDQVIRLGLEAQARTTPYRCPTFSMGEPLVNLDKATRLAGELEDGETIRKMARG